MLAGIECAHRGRQHAALEIPAVRHPVQYPGLLVWMAEIVRKTLNRGDFLADRRGNIEAARFLWLGIYKNRTGGAHINPTTLFFSGQTVQTAQYPQQADAGVVDADCVVNLVHVQDQAGHSESLGGVGVDQHLGRVQAGAATRVKPHPGSASNLLP